MAAGYLLCGKVNTDGLAKIALGQLCKSIDQFHDRCAGYLRTQGATPDLIAFGPFCARVLLENCCAAILGRLDTFRVLYLSKFQSQTAYEPGKRAKSAFSWSGDIIPEEKHGAELWSLDYESSKISRALFSRYADHIYWKPAVDKMLDHIAGVEYSPEFDELLKIDSENYVSECKGRLVQLYSMLSKAVHWEFFTNELVLDEPTVKNTMRESCLIVGHLGLVSHFISTAFGSLSPNEAVEEYVSFRRAIA